MQAKAPTPATATTHSVSTALTNLPYIAFLSAYPHPVFILRSLKLAGKGAPSLDPVFGNAAFRSLLFGPDADTSEVALGTAFLRTLDSIDGARSFTDWLERGSTPAGKNNGEVLTINMKLSWTTLDAKPVQLDVTQTHIDDFIVCVTSPRSPLPRLVPPPNEPTSSTRKSRLGRDRDVTMRLSDFPQASQLYITSTTSSTPMPFSSLVRTPKQNAVGGGESSGSTSSSAPSSRSPDQWNVEPFATSLSSLPGSEMREMVENHDWHTTPLGPRSAWPASLKASVSYVLASPYPHAVWWGPDVVLIYNDAYREMAGTKHPHIFAQRGSESWGELWESIGPLVKRVFAGEAVYESDDLLFFHRLTDAKLPEETYHNWSYVPVEQEDGTIGGFINSTFESTKKVINERRMVALRDLAHRAGVARTQAEFASAVMSVLNSSSFDVPFAAFYFASVTDASNYSYNAPRTSYIRKSVDEPPIRIGLRRAGTVGIPSDHPAVPPVFELFLDSLTLRLSPKTQARAMSPSPGSSKAQQAQGDNGSDRSVRLDGEIPGFNYEKAITAATSSEKTVTVPSSGSSPGDHSDSIRTTHRQAQAQVPPSPLHTRLPSATRSDDASRSASASASTVKSPAPHSACIWPFDLAFSTRRAVHLAHIPDYVVEGFEIRGWGEHAREAVVVPITVDDADLPVALLVMGLNSRRPYDEDYEAWIELTRLSLNSLLTAVKGRESDLIRADQLAELDDAKTAFFSNASHELRTPLTLIQGPINDSLDVVEEKKVKENLKLAARNVQRLSRLVDSLMDFSKIAANRLEGRFRPLQLGRFTADLASLFRSVVEKGHVDYVVDCDMNERKITYVDPDFWEKIVFNLIGNAFKYTMKGSIHVKVDYDDDKAYFLVRDTGEGIPQSDLTKVFNRFHRVDAVSRSHEGTGIGLSLTKELVKLHGGRIELTSKTQAESPDDHGSTFTVILPLGKDHIPTEHIIQDATVTSGSLLYAKGIVEEATHWTSRPPSDERTPSDSSESTGSSSDGNRFDPNTLFFMKSDVIFLVDDNADMRHYIKSLFLPFCKVVEAQNGQNALEMLDAGKVKPNVILTDVMMPVVDGFALISGVRSRPELRLIPIILLTAKESEEARVEGLLSGAEDFISKPFNGRELIARVHLQMQLGKRRIELEAKFIERTREIQLLSDLSPVGIIRADSEGRVLYANPRWRDICGLDSNDPIELWQERVCEADRELVAETWKNATSSLQTPSIEFQFENGKYTKGQYERLCTDDGICIGIIGTITDISDRRMYEASQLAHAQERETTARKRAEEAEERRKEADERRRGQELLIDVTSHELRQPVSAILNCSSLVRSNLGTLRDELASAHENRKAFFPSSELVKAIDDDLDALDAIYQCGLAQERIANDVLSLSRIQLQVLSIYPVEFELVAEVQRIVSIFRNEVKMKKINLDVQLGESLSRLEISRVRCDKARFGQVITNLLSNGIKFTDTSSDKRDILVNVEVSLRRPSNDQPCVPPEPSDDEPHPVNPDEPVTIYIFVSVKDSGPGLKPEDLALLFKRFQQGSNSHNVFGGSGLGLFVSRKLCDLMGGRIDVDSVYGGGATFRFFIEATTAKQAEDDTPQGEFTMQERKDSAPRPLHILITEDNLINQTVLNRQLQKVGCTTELAANGLQALQKVQALNAKVGASVQKRFDAILMDCEMPVMDGLSAVRRIRELEASGELPARNRIIALTGNARGAQIQSAIEAGMDDVIIKPYKLNDLLDKMQQP